jgi:hypothetical protein
MKELNDTINLLLKKKQIILYGPPGTGKTFYTKKIALTIIEEADIFEYITRADEEKPDDTHLEETVFKNKLFNEISAAIKMLSGVFIKSHKTMIGYYTKSKKTSRDIPLMWLELNSSRVHLRIGNYPEEKNNLSTDFIEDGFGGYPEVRVNNENDAKITIDLIKYAYENFSMGE